MRNIGLFIMLLYFFQAPAWAQGLKTEAETRQVCEDAARLFGGGQIKASFDSVAEHWMLPKGEINSLILQTENQLNPLSGRFGAFVGHEYIGTAKAGSSFLKYTYAIKMENHALRYLCYFYKPSDRWMVNLILWDDDIQLLFK